MILIIVKYQKLLAAQSIILKGCFLSYQELVCQNIFEEGD